MVGIRGKKTALLMAGGGMKGAFQVGYVRHMCHTRQWEIDTVSGVSTGALQAAVLGMGQFGGLIKLEELWFGLEKTEDLFLRPGWLKKSWRVLFGKSMSSNVPLRDLILKTVNVDTLRNPKVKPNVGVGVVDLSDGSYRHVTPDMVGNGIFLEFVLASTSIPGEFPAMYIDALHKELPPSWYCDGGVTSMIPAIDGLIKGGVERIVVCLCNPLKVDRNYRKYDRTIPVMERALEVCLHDNWTGDLDRMRSEVERINRFIREGKLNDGKRIIDFIVMAPTPPLPIGTLDVDPKKIRRAVHMGEEIACRAIDSYYGQSDEGVL